MPSNDQKMPPEPRCRFSPSRQSQCHNCGGQGKSFQTKQEREVDHWVVRFSRPFGWNVCWLWWLWRLIFWALCGCEMLLKVAIWCRYFLWQFLVSVLDFWSVPYKTIEFLGHKTLSGILLGDFWNVRFLNYQSFKRKTTRKLPANFFPKRKPFQVLEVHIQKGSPDGHKVEGAVGPWSRLLGGSRTWRCKYGVSG